MVPSQACIASQRNTREQSAATHSVNTRGETVLASVGSCDGLVVGLERSEGHGRTKDLFAVDLHLWLCLAEDDRLQDVSTFDAVCLADEDLGSLGRSIVDKPCDSLG